MLLPLREFKANDADLLCPTAVDSSLFDSEEQWRESAKVNAAAGPAYTALYKGRPIASAGIRLVENKDGDIIGWPWVVFSPTVEKCKRSVFETTLVMLKVLIDEYGLKRLVTDSRKGFEKSQRLLEHLGFKRVEEETDTHYYYVMEV